MFFNKLVDFAVIFFFSTSVFYGFNADAPSGYGSLPTSVFGDKFVFRKLNLYRLSVSLSLFFAQNIFYLGQLVLIPFCQ